MSKQPEEYLKHILQEIDYLTSEAKDLEILEFLKDETKMRAFARIEHLLAINLTP